MSQAATTSGKSSAAGTSNPATTGSTTVDAKHAQISAASAAAVASPAATGDAAGTGTKSERKKWMPLESNPELMNKYMRDLGVLDAEFSELLSFDDEMLSFVPQPCLAVLLLFPITEQSEQHKSDEAEQLRSSGTKMPANVYWMKQTIGNACGTIGLCHAVLNNAEKITLDKSKFFAKFLATTKKMTPDERAEALEKNVDVEEQHAAVASSSDAKSDVSHPVNDNLHFNAFVCIDSTLYELDGRKTAPIAHGSSSPATLLQDAVVVMRNFIARAPGDVRFSAVALVKP